jgi:hypothetical protein
MPPEFSPDAVNISELRMRLSAVPFLPFRIVTSSGKAYEVPTPDHLTILPLSRRVVVEHDDLSGAYISPLHITAIESIPSAA